MDQIIELEVFDEEGLIASLSFKTREAAKEYFSNFCQGSFNVLWAQDLGIYRFDTSIYATIEAQTIH